MISDPNTAGYRPAPVERLDAHPVAREQQPPAARVPDCEREHAAEVIDAGIAPLLVGMDDGFGVATRPVAMTGGFELRADVGVVVDLAVEDDPDRPVFVRQRLMAGCHIDDAQPAMGQTGEVVDVDAGFVRATMPDDVPHRTQPRPLLWLQPVRSDDSGNSAHTIRDPGPALAPARNAMAALVRG